MSKYYVRDGADQRIIDEFGYREVSHAVSAPYPLVTKDFEVDDKIISVCYTKNAADSSVVGYSRSADTSAVHELKDLTEEQLLPYIQELIDADLIYKEVVCCSMCSTKFKSSTYYKYEDEIFCESCLLDKLENEGVVETSTTTNYSIGGEWVGDDNDMDAVYECLVDNYGVEEIK